jgi:hypothetical protein
MNSNEKLTINWVRQMVQSNKTLITTDTVLTTLKKKGLSRVSDKLKTYGILTFTDYVSEKVFFVKESDNRIKVIKESGWMLGIWTNGDNIMFLPTTPLQ